MTMKVKVRQWCPDCPNSPALTVWFYWLTGRVPGECFERIMLKHGKEHWLYRPSYHGEDCPSNGAHPGIECRCDECAHYLVCFPEHAPDWDALFARKRGRANVSPLPAAEPK